MQVNGIDYTTIWEEGGRVEIIDQRALPFLFKTLHCERSEQLIDAIINMAVRGAPLIGVAGAYAFAMALAESDEDPGRIARRISSARPTAVNLSWAVQDSLAAVERSLDRAAAAGSAWANARKIRQEDMLRSRKIGENGFNIIKNISDQKRGTVNILTHCNAGWLAAVDYGTALAPIYVANERGIDLHVWVDETRPRNQGSKLTAWELDSAGIKHTIIADNVGGHLMQHGMVDVAIVGADRVAANGDAANKIGTYLKALAAKDNGVPFYVALPGSTFDFNIEDGVRDIPIETRDESEVKFFEGSDESGVIRRVFTCPPGSPAANYGFDVTPARLITGFICESGIIPPDKIQTVKK
ncbi:MAG: S-methyl-5-thioribose-1-phosphate isomerase [Chloroflexota bacterium]